MKVAQLLEADELGELKEIMLLVKHARMPRGTAEELHKKLKDFKIMVSGKHVPAQLRWTEDRVTGTLKFISSDIPGSWKSGPSAVGRAQIVDILQQYGFTTARFAADAVKRTARRFNGPHIYFWGSFTPAPKPDNFKKVWGTEEAYADHRDKIKAVTK